MNKKPLYKRVIQSAPFILLCIVGISIAVGIFSTLIVQRYNTDTEEVNKKDTVSVKWRQNHFLLSEENLYNELVAQGVDFPEIVTAQALLETGHFKSYACSQQNNLFGLRDNKGKYMSFPHWTDAVAAYKKYIQRYNHPVPEDYYAYLQELGYAEDPQYIDKLKQIVNK